MLGSSREVKGLTRIWLPERVFRHQGNDCGRSVGVRYGGTYTMEILSSMRVLVDRGFVTSWVINGIRS